MQTQATQEPNKSNSIVAVNKTRQQPFFSPLVQTKLSIGAADDPYEREADAMADRVMRMPAAGNNPAFFKPSPIPSVQAKCEHCEEEEKLQRKENATSEIDGSASLESYTSTLPGTGKSLPDSDRQFFEPRFGHDFSDVRIHNDNAAAQSAENIHALAYTYGNNIVFNQNQFAPETDQGKRLIAHELTHVVQQGSSVQKSIQRDLAIEPAFPEVEEPILTTQQIRNAIIYNNDRYDTDNILQIQQIVGGPVTGVMTEETIRLVALYQAQNGLTTDGMIGTTTFDQLTAEQGAEGVSPDTCLTMFRVGLITPMQLHSAGAGLANIFGHFDVEIQFSPHCDCSRFQYRQFICGLVTYNGANMNNQFSIPGGAGGLPAIPNWVEDGNTNLPDNGRYGHREHQPDNGLPNKYLDADGNPDMLNGCRFRSFDEPGVVGAPANSGDVWAFDFRFYGEIRRDGQMVQRKFWAVRETLTIP